MGAHFKIFLLIATASFSCLISVLNVQNSNTANQTISMKLEQKKEKKYKEVIKKSGFKTAQLKVD